MHKSSLTNGLLVFIIRMYRKSSSNGPACLHGFAMHRNFIDGKSMFICMKLEQVGSFDSNELVCLHRN